MTAAASTTALAAPPVASKPAGPVTIRFRVPTGTRLEYRATGTSTLLDFEASGTGPEATPEGLKRLEDTVRQPQPTWSGPYSYTVASIARDGTRHLRFAGDLKKVGRPDEEVLRTRGNLKFDKRDRLTFLDVHTAVSPTSASPRIDEDAVGGTFETAFMFVYGEPLTVDRPRLRDIPRGGEFGGGVAQTAVHAVTTLRGTDTSGNYLVHVTVKAEPATYRRSANYTVKAQSVINLDLVVDKDGRPVTGHLVNNQVQTLALRSPERQSTINVRYVVSQELTLTR